MFSPSLITERDFDIFSRSKKGAWQFTRTVTAKSPENAKNLFMHQEGISNPNNVAVYLKR